MTTQMRILDAGLGVEDDKTLLFGMSTLNTSSLAFWLSFSEYLLTPGVTLKCKTKKVYSGFYRRTNKHKANQVWLC